MTSRYLLRKLPSPAELKFAQPAWASYWKNLTLDQARFNIGPHPHKTATIFTHSGVQEMLFGMKPYWAKALLPNAKAESIKHSRFWKPLAAMRPCLIPADGFYVTEDLKTAMEQNKSRIWHGVEFSDHREFFIAGLWKPIKDDANDQTILHFVLLTRESHSCVKNISERMPVVFGVHEIKQLQIWMNTELNLDERIGVLLEPITFPELISFPVSMAIKNLGRDDVSLFEPLYRIEPV